MNRTDICKTICSLSGEAGHQKVLEVYNSQKVLPRSYRLQNSDPWCAATVSAVFLLNGYDGFSECSCVMMIYKAKQLGIWVEDDAYLPQIGDVVMYDWQDTGWGDNVGVADHVGIVIGVSDTDITVREGNYNHSIRERVIKINGRYIRGFITPPYDDIQSEIDALPHDSGNVSPETINTTSETSKPQEEAENKENKYIIGNIYSICVQSYLNVRTGPGIRFPLMGYSDLTSDGKKHANKSGALKTGTRVTCLEVKNDDDGNIWIRIPSGWICAKFGNSYYVK